MTAGRAGTRLRATPPPGTLGAVPTSDPSEVFATVRQVAGVGLEVELPALRLRVLSGPDQGRRWDLALDVVRLGSAPDSDVVLTGPTVSRQHAELSRVEGRLALRDLGSTNGTWVEGVQVVQAYLRPGQNFRLGDTELTVEPRRERRTGLVGEDEGLGPLVGRTPEMRRLYGVLRAVAETHATVLVQGESGTGKELVAQALHELSARRGPLVVFDCATTDPEMIRSDLFGHLEGAFTGAQRDRHGAFRAAHGGTLFLDEVGELPLDLQARLLRALESRRVTPLGSDEAVPVDVRVVAATHRDLAQASRQGSFRLDLFHRLAVVPVEVPPLRRRLADLDLLIPHLAAGLGVELRLSTAARGALARHPWPGNVRELRNVLERAAALAPGREVGPEDLLLHPGPDATAPGVPAPEAAAPGIEADRDAVLAALERNGGNKAATARELGISLSTLHRRLRRYRGT